MSVAKGIEGEQDARAFLESLGCLVIKTNWRFKRAEIDLIATHGDEIIFVEVKRRANNTFGYPEESVTPQKARHLRRGIEGFLALHRSHLQPRVDIVAITDNPPGLVHYADVELP